MAHRATLLGAATVAVLLHAMPALASAEPAAPAGTVTRAKDPDSLLGDFSLRSKSEPISVRADKLEFSYRERILTYTGSVVVTQADLTLKADVLSVSIDESGADRLRQIVATGNVEIRQGERSATGGKAVFDQTARRLELTDSPVLKEGPNQISGDRVIVYLDEERSVVEGGDKRVQALLFPGGNLEALAGEKRPGTP